MIDVTILLILLALGYGFGRFTEIRHYRSIRERETQFRNIPAIATKLPDPALQPKHTQLVAGNVVISVDFFKRFLAGLRNIVGGRVVSYESLMDRARREAILRMKQEAHGVGATHIFNVKLETSSIYKGRKNAIGSVEVLAYGTAFFD
ncbi:MAG: YbjQ family protein [Gammaproteobacteria bacterium]|nr:YbjQ family protein [Gammaproteobacteria bacterium]